MSPAGISHPASESKVDAHDTLYFRKVKENSGYTPTFSLKNQAYDTTMGTHANKDNHSERGLPRMCIMPATLPAGGRQHTAACPGNISKAHTGDSAGILHAAQPHRELSKLFTCLIQLTCGLFNAPAST